MGPWLIDVNECMVLVQAMPVGTSLPPDTLLQQGVWTVEIDVFGRETP